MLGPPPPARRSGGRHRRRRLFHRARVLESSSASAVSTCARSTGSKRRRPSSRLRHFRCGTGLERAPVAEGSSGLDPGWSCIRTEASLLAPRASLCVVKEEGVVRVRSPLRQVSRRSRLSSASTASPRVTAVQSVDAVRPCRRRGPEATTRSQLAFSALLRVPGVGDVGACTRSRRRIRRVDPRARDLCAASPVIPFAAYASSGSPNGDGPTSRCGSMLAYARGAALAAAAGRPRASGTTPTPKALRAGLQKYANELQIWSDHRFRIEPAPNHPHRSCRWRCAALVLVPIAGFAFPPSLERALVLSRHRLASQHFCSYRRSSSVLETRLAFAVAACGGLHPLPIRLRGQARAAGAFVAPRARRTR